MFAPSVLEDGLPPASISPGVDPTVAAEIALHLGSSIFCQLAFRQESARSSSAVYAAGEHLVQGRAAPAGPSPWRRLSPYAIRSCGDGLVTFAQRPQPRRTGAAEIQRSMGCDSSCLRGCVLHASLCELAILVEKRANDSSGASSGSPSMAIWRTTRALGSPPTIRGGRLSNAAP